MLSRHDSHDSLLRRNFLALIFVMAALIVFISPQSATAHPLGNFTINHFARIATGTDRVRVHYVIDMAEIPTFQELQTIDTDHDGKPSSAELDAYAGRLAAQYASGLLLTIDGARIPLSVTAQQAATVQGAGGLPTLRLECDLAGDIPAQNANGGGNDAAKNARRLRFEDTNYQERIGWHEIVVVPASGVAVFDSNAYGTSATNELRNYPQDILASPLDERIAEFSFAAGSVPANSTALRTRDGHAVDQTRDRFAELINVEVLTPTVALLGLLIAALLGALHAFSPGHGKTVVGAYLVGSRGTAGHAAFLGLTVTVTHTIGVFALGLITLFASQYIMPERLYPILGFISGGIVLAMGLSLFVQRLRSALNPSSVDKDTHAHLDLADAHTRVDAATHELLNEDADHAQLDLAKNPAMVHSHGGSVHSHLPPGADGGGVTWRSLLALGISGGLLPCPSALVVLLSAITLHRVGYGMFLVVAFSLGLACTLTAIGLAFVYAGRWMKRPAGSGRLVRVLPVVSALVVACIGLALCFQALGQAGYNFSSVMSRFTTQSQAVTRSSAQGKVF